MHDAIKRNIDYWSTNIGQMVGEPPFHSSYYCVDEGGELKVYGVKWNGSDLSKGEVFVPEMATELLADARIAIAKGHAIGDKIWCGESPTRTVDCYVFNSPGRQVMKWNESHTFSPPQALTHRFRVNKRTHNVSFENETEEEVIIRVEPKG